MAYHINSGPRLVSPKSDHPSFGCCVLSSMMSPRPLPDTEGPTALWKESESFPAATSARPDGSAVQRARREGRSGGGRRGRLLTRPSTVAIFALRRRCGARSGLDHAPLVQPSPWQTASKSIQFTAPEMAIEILETTAIHEVRSRLGATDRSRRRRCSPALLTRSSTSARLSADMQIKTGWWSWRRQSSW